MTGWIASKVDVVTPPTSELLPTQDMLDYLRVFPSESTLVSRFISACRIDLEKRLGRALSQQAIKVIYRYLLPQTALVSTIIESTIDLFMPPVVSVSQVEILTNVDTWTVYDVGLWHSREDSVVIDDITTMYALNRYLYTRITYAVGPTILDPADAMMLMQYVAHAYVYREDDSIPDGVGEAVTRTKNWAL